MTADNEEFARFVNGELFADGFGYKFHHDAQLLDEDAVYMRYEKYFIDNVITMDSESRILSKDTVLWFVRHPVEIAPLSQGIGDYDNTVPEMPDAIFDVDELGIIDASMLENLDSISLKTYGFAGNDGVILATGSLFATAIQT